MNHKNINYKSYEYLYILYEFDNNKTTCILCRYFIIKYNLWTVLRTWKNHILCYCYEANYAWYVALSSDGNWTKKVESHQYRRRTNDKIKRTYKAPRGSLSSVLNGRCYRQDLTCILITWCLYYYLFIYNAHIKLEAVFFTQD